MKTALRFVSVNIKPNRKGGLRNIKHLEHYATMVIHISLVMSGIFFDQKN